MIKPELSAFFYEQTRKYTGLYGFLVVFLSKWGYIYPILAILFI